MPVAVVSKKDPQQERPPYTAGRNRVAAAEAAAPGEASRHAAAMSQLLAVVEGLEEELFAAEAACHEAEVEAQSATNHVAVRF